MPDVSIRRETVSRIMPDVHAALKHLLSAWDHLYSVEQVVGFEITTGELADLAGGLDRPKDVRAAVNPTVVHDWLRHIRDAAK